MRSSSRSIKAAAALLLASLAAAAPAATSPRRLPPVDQCVSDRSFVAFRAALKRVVAKRDRAAFVALLAPDVEVDFGGGSGRDAFAKQWSFDPGEHDNLWEWLDRMLGMGCARSNAARIIPSLIEQLDGVDGDLFDRRLVLPGAKLFEEPYNQATAVAISPWALVTAINTGGDAWTGVRLSDGRKGYVSDDQLYEPLGYRMVIEQRRGKWMITAFVAGD